MEIKVTHRKYGEHTVLIDDKDYDLIRQYSLYVQYGGREKYPQSVRFIKDNKSILLHRIIMNCPYGMEVDHINGNVMDNRKENLRVCTHAENVRNRKVSDHSSKYKGVSFHKDSGKWHTQIRHQGKKIHVGLFLDESEAARMYDEASKKYHGEYGKCNFTI